MPSIYTAVPLIEMDSKQSLLQNSESESSTASKVEQSDKQQGDITNKNSIAFDHWRQRNLLSKKFFNGFWVGFIIQSVSLGSSAIMAIHYGVSEEDSQDSLVSKDHGFFYFLFFILSQSWWLIFPVICISIDSGFANRKGQAILAKYFCRSHPTNSDSVSHRSQRDIFLGCVRFHVGIVFGCFIIWGMIDFYFGASLGVFAALTASLVACLGLCYSMIVIYDRFIYYEEQQETEHSPLEEI